MAGVVWAMKIERTMLGCFYLQRTVVLHAVTLYRVDDTHDDFDALMKSRPFHFPSGLHSEEKPSTLLQDALR